LKQQVRIKVYGEQVIEGEKETQSIETMGEYYVKDGRRYVLYREVMEDGGKVRTIVKETKDGIDVVKNGYISVKMCFAEGLNNNCMYETPLGNVKLRTLTNYIKKQEREDGFLWEFGYSIYMDDQYVGENILGLDVTF